MLIYCALLLLFCGFRFLVIVLLVWLELFGLFDWLFVFWVLEFGLFFSWLLWYCVCLCNMYVLFVFACLLFVFASCLTMCMVGWWLLFCG